MMILTVWCRAGVQGDFLSVYTGFFLLPINARKPLKPACTIPGVVPSCFCYIILVFYQTYLSIALLFKSFGIFSIAYRNAVRGIIDLFFIT